MILGSWYVEVIWFYVVMQLFVKIILPIRNLCLKRDWSRNTFLWEVTVSMASKWKDVTVSIAIIFVEIFKFRNIVHSIFWELRISQLLTIIQEIRAYINKCIFSYFIINDVLYTFLVYSENHIILNNMCILLRFKWSLDPKKCYRRMILRICRDQDVV